VARTKQQKRVLQRRDEKDKVVRLDPPERPPPPPPRSAAIQDAARAWLSDIAKR
jgi:hypothetical protein